MQNIVSKRLNLAENKKKLVKKFWKYLTLNFKRVNYPEPTPPNNKNNNKDNSYNNNNSNNNLIFSLSDCTCKPCRNSMQEVEYLE